MGLGSRRSDKGKDEVGLRKEKGVSGARERRERSTVRKRRS